MRFAVVDVETSGLSTRWHRLLQVGVVSVEDGRIVDEWESLVRRRWPLQRVGPRRVHGITRADLKDAPPLREVMQHVAERVDGNTLVAHNLEFDSAFLDRAGRSAEVQLSPTNSICTLLLSRRLDPERQLNHRLGDLAERYGVVNERPHDALSDARTTALVLPHLLAEAEVSDDAALAALSATQSEYFASRR